MPSGSLRASPMVARRIDGACANVGFIGPRRYACRIAGLINIYPVILPHQQHTNHKHKRWTTTEVLLLACYHHTASKQTTKGTWWVEAPDVGPTACLARRLHASLWNEAPSGVQFGTVRQPGFAHRWLALAVPPPAVPNVHVGVRVAVRLRPTTARYPDLDCDGLEDPKLY